MTVEVTPTSRRLRHATRVPAHRTLGAILAVLAAVTGFGLVFVETSLDRIDDGFTTHDISALLPAVTEDPDAEPVDPSSGESIDILLLGSDTRIGDDNQALGGGDVDGMRNDTTIIAHISADRQRIELVSIPRDSRVRISECRMLDGSLTSATTGKFNIAFANGGQNGNVGEAAACVASTIYDLTGIRIDHYAVVDFAGFIGMVDALDGVPMCIPNDVYSVKANLDLKAGAQVLDGETALAWARARTGEGLGDGTDLMRIERQQELLTNMARKALGLNMLTDATKGTAFVNALAQSLTMDPELGDSHYLLGLAWSLRNFDTKNLYMTTTPWHYPTDNNGDVVWTEPDATELWARLLADEPIDPDYDDGSAPEPSATEATGSADADGAATPSETTDATEDTTEEATAEATDEPADEPSETADPEPSATESTSTPTVSSTPERETEQDILNSCG
ncbi:LCP family protein [Demequina pelophila]|uniref:LCP family protein n=1 Tax=Demequina pelophila TaxID=1638984 RepID=UPI000785FC65|nr:LCP family protein [Demequina pelophila]